MKLNIFCIPVSEVDGLKSKLMSSNMQLIREVDQAGWHGEFFYSSRPFGTRATWAEPFKDYFADGAFPTNLSYYAAFVFTRDELCYALSYGKTHFYLRSFSDYDFGIEVAKRIANERDVKQTSSRRFQGKRTKDIRSYAANTQLDVESGASVEFLQGGIIKSKQDDFGKSGKFGTSVLLTKDIGAGELGPFLNKLTAEMQLPPRFKLPRTTVVTEEDEVERFDAQLLEDLLSPPGTTDFSQNSYDLYGVDFVFSSQGSFKLRCPGYPELELEELTVRQLKEFITSRKIHREEITRIKVVHMDDGHGRRTQPLKEALDFIADTDRVLLSGGKWLRFNQDYLDYLDEYLRDIPVEEVEPEFEVIFSAEPEFNASEALKNAGYESADKNFNIFKTRSSTPVEAWDLKKGTCVYAVKFGTPQKLGPVCDQAINLLELLRNQAGVKQVPDFNQYCLWLGYRSQKGLSSIADCGSIIFKQKIEAWARKAREVGIEPVLKISRKEKPPASIVSSSGNGASV